MHLCIQIPVFNEEETIAAVVNKSLSVAEESWPEWTISVRVYDDGSTDKSSSIVRALCESDSRVYLTKFSRNTGVGNVFLAGLADADNLGVDILIHIDADHQFDPKLFKYLVQPILQKECEVAVASRFKDKHLTPKMKTHRKWGNSLLSLFISAIISERFFDTTCGFRAHSSVAISLLRENLFPSYTFTYPSIVIGKRLGLRFRQVPLEVRGEREFGEEKISKHPWIYGFYIFVFFARFIPKLNSLKKKSSARRRQNS